METAPTQHIPKHAWSIEEDVGELTGYTTKFAKVFLKSDSFDRNKSLNALVDDMHVFINKQFDKYFKIKPSGTKKMIFKNAVANKPQSLEDLIGSTKNVNKVLITYSITLIALSCT